MRGYRDGYFDDIFDWSVVVKESIDVLMSWLLFLS